MSKNSSFSISSLERVYCSPYWKAHVIEQGSGKFCSNVPRFLTPNLTLEWPSISSIQLMNQVVQATDFVKDSKVTLYIWEVGLKCVYIVSVCDL